MRIPGAEQHGFTLAESLLAVAIAAATLAMAAPALDALRRDNTQAVSVNELVSTLHLARSEAITRNARVTVCASRDAERCEGEWQEGWIAFLDANADQARDADEALLDRSPALQGLQVESDAFPLAFSYRNDGRIEGDEPGASTGAFSFCAPGATEAERVVIVRASGLPLLANKGTDGQPVRCSAS